MNIVHRPKQTEMRQRWWDATIIRKVKMKLNGYVRVSLRSVQKEHDTWKTIHVIVYVNKWIYTDYINIFKSIWNTRHIAKNHRFNTDRMLLQKQMNKSSCWFQVERMHKLNFVGRGNLNYEINESQELWLKMSLICMLFIQISGYKKNSVLRMKIVPQIC